MYNQAAINTYKTVAKTTTVSGRETEARVLTEGANKLRQCQQQWQEATRPNLLDEALRYNQRIWTIFQSELIKEGNPLPQAVKLDIFRLSRFVDKRIFEVMGSPAPEKLDILIKINENLAEGLRGSTA